MIKIQNNMLTIDLTEAPPPANDLPAYFAQRYQELLRQSKRNSKTETQSLLETCHRKCQWENNCESKMVMHSLKPVHTAAATASYTGFRFECINKIKETNQVECETIEQTIRYQYHIRTVLASMYLSKILPTTNRLLQCLVSQVPVYWSLHTLRKHLKQMGFRWRRVPKTKWWYIIEKPDQIFERFRYLKNIIAYRKDRPIFFIEENFFDSDGNYMKLSELADYKCVYKNRETPVKWFLIYVLSGDGVLITKMYMDIARFDFCEWVFEDLLPLLPASSVIVHIDGNRKLEQMPRITPDSSKADMMAYLDSHGMPYVEDMRKAELLELIETVQDTKGTSKLEELVRSQGFEMLRLPLSLRSITPGSIAFADLRKRLREADISENPLTTLLDVTKTCFEEFDFKSVLSIIEDEEKEHYETEIKLDKLIDSMETSIDLIMFTDKDLDSDVSDNEE